jgi:phenylacetate-CoA ligase
MGYYNRSFRKIKDRLLGYCRFSAYDMSVDKMRAAAQAMVDFRPDYIIGYSVALDSLARYNQDKADVFCHLGLKAVIATAEGFPSDDSADLVSRVIGSPVAMEYGAVETGVIAHSHPEGGYRVFWRTYFLEAQEDAVGGGKKLRVTSLYPRCFPLIRYEIGDEIIPSVGEPEWGVARFDRVIGRCNDYLVLADGSRVHSELITHAVRCCDDILAYQAVQTDSSVRLNVVSQVDLSSETIGAIRARLRTINPLLGAIEVARVSELRRTVAGKTPIIIRKPVLMA